MEFAAEFEIAGRVVGGNAPCLIIAEAGVNHFGDMNKAFGLVDLAADAGADVLKIQHFHTDQLVGPSAADWRERLRSKELSEAQVLEIRDYCDKRGIMFMCTGHDEQALDFLDREVGVPAFKVGSGEIGNWPSLKSLGARGKPIILSTGMYQLSDIEAAVDAIAESGNRSLALLHCVTLYPTPPELANVRGMDDIRALFSGPVGYSDHTEGTAVPLAAVARGAKIIEKHITLDRDVPNAQDWKVSCDPSNFAKFVADIREIEAALSGAGKIVSELEQANTTWARKSLTAQCDIAQGQTVTESMLIAQRPGSGMPPSAIGDVVGRPAVCFIAAGTPISEDMLG